MSTTLSPIEALEMINTAVFRYLNEQKEPDDQLVFEYNKSHECEKILKEERRRTALSAARHQQEGKEDAEFIKFIDEVRTCFSHTAAGSVWWNMDAPMRVAFENVLIAYDQMAERFRSSPSTATGGWVWASERVPELGKMLNLRFKDIPCTGCYEKFNSGFAFKIDRRGTYAEPSFEFIEWYDDTAPAISVKKEAIAVIDFLLDANANGVDGNSIHKIILSDGDLYWEADEDGDQPISAEELYSLYKKSQP